MARDEALRAQFEHALERRDPALERPGPHDRGDADEQDVGGDRDPRVRDPDDQVAGGVRGADLDQSAPRARRRPARARPRRCASAARAARRRRRRARAPRRRKRRSRRRRPARIWSGSDPASRRAPVSAPKRFISPGDCSPITAAAASVATISAPTSSWFPHQWSPSEWRVDERLDRRLRDQRRHRREHAAGKPRSHSEIERARRFNDLAGLTESTTPELAIAGPASRRRSASRPGRGCDRGSSYDRSFGDEHEVSRRSRPLRSRPRVLAVAGQGRRDQRRTAVASRRRHPRDSRGARRPSPPEDGRRR